MSSPKVVIIGAGVVGAALADELTARGCTDVTVLDQGPLFATGGSSSHAPGLVFQCNGSKAMTEFASYTVRKIAGLELDGKPCFHSVGGLEVATTPERLAELHRRRGWLEAWGVESRLLDPAECVQHYDLLDRELVYGGLHTPSDGILKAVWAVEAQARAAIARGAQFIERREVLDVLTTGGRVTGVRTDAGDVPADVVVCCAGIWGPKVARMVGMTLPLTPLAHQFAWTSQVPALTGQTAEVMRPILRHQDHDLYYRERGDLMGIGYYGHRPMPLTADDLVPYDDAEIMPSVLRFTDQDFEPAWTESQRLLPSLSEAKVDEGMNGVFSFTPDNMPLIGESTQAAGFWVAEAVWVTHSAGVAKAVAEWLVDGKPSADLHECDVNRFEKHQLAPDYLLARDCQNFVEVYDILHPLQPMDDPRPLRTSPFYPRQQELGAVFLEANGWERPHWYGANADLVDGRTVPQPDPWAAQFWSPIAAAEAQVTRERVALYDMTALKRLEVSGPGALAFLDHVTTGKMDKSVGAVTYTLLLDETGGIRSDVTVARLGHDVFQVGANGNLDLDRLHRLAPTDGSVVIRDTTPETCCVGVWGPQARDLVQALCQDDLSNASLKYFRAKQTYVGMVPVTVLRLSYVGELGYEIYASADMGLKLWDTLWQAGQEYGIVAGGRAAFNGMRLEKGYRSFGTDMTWEHDPYEAGVGFAVRMDKGDFIGKAALAARDPERIERKLTCLVLGENDVVMGKEPVYAGDECVGYVTSSGWGYTLGHGIAYAWLPAELATTGNTVHIGYFDRRVPARVADEPLFDPDMTRLRG
ncbi:MAG: FAD-dependent oxidoreductase [Streptosporangiales bacterium]|nr:FAD-dependent oxidoreductase [Streptosporangiales bacterium]